VLPAVLKALDGFDVAALSTEPAVLRARARIAHRRHLCCFGCRQEIFDRLTALLKGHLEACKCVTLRCAALHALYLLTKLAGTMRLCVAMWSRL
jgi:hypothetical protein